MTMCPPGCKTKVCSESQEIRNTKPGLGLPRMMFGVAEPICPRRVRPVSLSREQPNTLTASQACVPLGKYFSRREVAGGKVTRLGFEEPA